MSTDSLQHERRFVLYLDSADILGLEVDPADARAAIAEAFRDFHAGEAVSPPKLALDEGPGHAFQSLCAASAKRGFACNKWVGFAPPAATSNVSPIDAIVTLNDHASGQIVAILDGASLTGLRTAAMSAFAASTWARGDSRSMGFVGCGLQARTHLAAMTSLLPGLKTVRALARTRQSADAFLAHARSLGLETAPVEDARGLVEASDIVVTTVPMSPGFEPFLSADWIAPGAFVAAVDVGRSWRPETLRRLDFLITDSHEQQALHPIAADVHFDADFAELAAGVKPARQRRDQRAMLVFRGFGLADLAVASLVFGLARKRGIGTELRR